MREELPEVAFLLLAVTAFSAALYVAAPYGNAHTWADSARGLPYFVAAAAVLLALAPAVRVPRGRAAGMLAGGVALAGCVALAANQVTPPDSTAELRALGAFRFMLRWFTLPLVVAAAVYVLRERDAERARERDDAWERPN